MATTKSSKTVTELTTLAAITPVANAVVDMTTVSFTTRLQVKRAAAKINPTESNLYYNPTLVEQAATAALIA